MSVALDILQEVRKGIDPKQLENQIRNWIRVEVVSKLPEEKLLTKIHAWDSKGIDWLKEKYLEDHFSSYNSSNSAGIKVLQFTGEVAYAISLMSFKEIEEDILRGSGWSVGGHRKQSVTGVDLAISRPEKINQMPRILYHITHPKNLKTVMSTGLKPHIRADGKFLFTSSRLYLFTEPSRLMFENMAKQLPGVKDQAGSDYAVIKINTKKFSKLNIYRDHFAIKYDAVWTPSHVPAEALEVGWELM